MRVILMSVLGIGGIMVILLHMSPVLSSYTLFEMTNRDATINMPPVE